MWLNDRFQPKTFAFVYLMIKSTSVFLLFVLQTRDTMEFILLKKKCPYLYEYLHFMLTTYYYYYDFVFQRIQNSRHWTWFPMFYHIFEVRRTSEIYESFGFCLFDSSARRVQKTKEKNRSHTSKVHRTIKWISAICFLWPKSTQISTSFFYCCWFSTWW